MVADEKKYLKPGQAMAPSPTAIVRQKMEPMGWDQKAAISMKTVWKRNPAQLNTFRTWVVVKYFLTRNQSAHCPENWMRTDINKYGSADRNPDLPKS